LDQIYNYAESKLSLGAQIILMSTTQGAQVIANSQAASKANAIILVSPLAGNLEKTWVQGLYKAHKQKTNFDSKNRILNEAESTQALFNSLKNGKIAANTHVFGASLTFWQSWLASSEMTIRDLALTEKPVLILTSTNDVFSAYEHIINNKFYIKNKRNFIITNISNSERNFINNNKLQEQAVTEVVNFIKNLSTKSSKISGNS
jgi:hypothetical protein